MLKFAIQDFKEDRELKQVAKATITNYMGCLSEFHGFCIKREIVDVVDVTASAFKQYLIHYQKEQNNKSWHLRRVYPFFLFG